MIKVFNIFNCCSSTVVSIFTPPQPPPHPTPPPTLDYPLWLCPCVLYTCFLMTLSPFPLLSPPPFPLLTVSLFFVKHNSLLFASSQYLSLSLLYYSNGVFSPLLDCKIFYTLMNTLTMSMQGFHIKMLIALINEPVTGRERVEKENHLLHHPD